MSIEMVKILADVLQSIVTILAIVVSFSCGYLYRWANHRGEQQ